MRKSFAGISKGAAKRIRIEQKIVKSLVFELLGHGFALSVHDGEEWFPATRNANELFDQLMETDMDRLYVHDAGDPDPMGWVFLVYGNDGWDVISDWTVSLVNYIQETIALAESLED